MLLPSSPLLSTSTAPFLCLRHPSSNTGVHLLSLSLSLPLPEERLLTSKSYSDSSWIAPSLLSHTGFDATLQMRFSTLPSPLFTWRREIPMQLPILYSISSSGEVTLALHGWQSTFLQNCIVIGQTQHCQSRRICGATQ